MKMTGRLKMCLDLIGAKKRDIVTAQKKEK